MYKRFRNKPGKKKIMQDFCNENYKVFPWKIKENLNEWWDIHVHGYEVLM